MNWTAFRTPLGLALALWLGWLQGCSTVPSPSAGPAAAAGEAEPALKARPAPPRPAASVAHNDKAYRQDAARHLYARQAARIYAGRLPPMLYAVGVLDVEIDRSGQVQALRWTRAPRHAPEVVAEIEQMVRAAAPFPAPKNLAKVTYTDVWLWDRSGRFQLDTLTEGQD